MATNKEKILSLLANGDWVFGYHIEKVNTPLGWLGTSGLSTCRKLEQKQIIEKKFEGRYVMYRIKQTNLENNRILQISKQFPIKNIIINQTSLL